MSTRLDVFDELSDIDAANVVRCARVLLRRPLLRTGGPDGDLLPLVHRYRAALTELFSSLLGYRLVVERRFARLYKAGPGPDPTRGESGMSPRGYAYLALTLAVLTGIGQQVLLSRLVADVRSAAVEAGNVMLVQGAWNDAFLDEARVFPMGARDDQVDAAASAFLELTQRGVALVA